MQTALFTKVFGGRTLDAAFGLAADLDYDGVEVMCRDPHLGRTTTTERARSLRQRLDEEGLAVAGLATYTGGYAGKSRADREDEIAALETFIDLSEVLGTDLLRHQAGGPPPREADDAAYETTAEWLGRAADVAADAGKRLALELHHGGLTETVDSTLRLLDRVDRSNLGVIHDAGNMYIAGEAFGPDALDRLGEHLFHVHVKDERRVGDPTLPGAFEAETRNGPETFQHRRLGHGAVDHTPVFDALAERGYEGYVSAECHAATGDAWTDATNAAHELEVIEQYRRAATGNRP